MKKMTFNKEDKKWYIFLPQWEGDKSDLEMVSGADRMLDYLSNNTDTVTVDVSEEPIEDAVKLKNYIIYMVVLIIKLRIVQM